MPKKKQFNPEGRGYDYVTAKKHGLKANKTGHWPSRVPKTGMLLKGSTHPTWNKTIAAEKRLGYKMYKKGGRYYSQPPK